MNTSQIIYPKELSWLAFNERVLQEAADPRNPIIERLRFMGIFSNNQDEYFKVRVAGLRRKSQQEELRSGTHEARTLLNKVQAKVRKLSDEFDAIYAELEVELQKKKIFLLKESELSEKQSAWLKQRFKNKILRHIVPILVTSQRRLENSLQSEISYLIVQLKKGSDISYYVIDLPESLPRFVNVPPDRGTARNYFMMMDEVIRHCLDEIFGGFFDYDALDAWSMKFSRDSDYTLGEDHEQSLIKKLSEGMKQRMHGEPVRLSYDRTMPKAMRLMLQDQLGFEDLDTVIPGGRYRNFRDFIGFPNPIGPHLEFRKLPSVVSKRFTQKGNVFDAIDEADILLHYPYHRFSHFTEFVRQAAFDPSVTAIQINIYRAAKNSRVAESLIDAAKNGKFVSVNIELTARFDEQHNLQMTEKFVDAGIRVTFGIPSLKVHSKLCVVSREIAGKERLYSVISTGNFNEKTAKIYTDFALFTSNQEICSEAREVFSFIDHSYRQPRLRHLMVSPINTREGISKRIQQEITNVQAGGKGLIRAKMNNLDDGALIADLCEASEAGVKIELLIRGMCTLKPGVSGISSNIRIISIVDRYLEHSRVVHFHNNGFDDVFISSADWMSRNLDERVEVTAPIYDDELKKQILATLEMQFKDNAKARIINTTQNNPYVSRGNRRTIRSQHAIHNLVVGMEEDES
jgi:polyphosphate kinase